MSEGGKEVRREVGIKKRQGPNERKRYVQSIWFCMKYGIQRRWNYQTDHRHLIIPQLTLVVSSARCHRRRVGIWQWVMQLKRNPGYFDTRIESWQKVNQWANNLPLRSCILVLSFPTYKSVLVCRKMCPQ